MDRRPTKEPMSIVTTMIPIPSASLSFCPNTAIAKSLTGLGTVSMTKVATPETESSSSQSRE